MNATELVRLYSGFYPSELLKSKFEIAMKFLPEEISHAVPSIQLGPDGLTLSSVALVTRNYICDLRLSNGNLEHELDFIAKNTIFNYHIKNWTREIKEEETVKATFELSEVNLRHEGSSSLRTQLFFAGNAAERDAWIANLTNAIPINLVLAFARLT